MDPLVERGDPRQGVGLVDPGDLLATGTPDGVGVAMNPPSFLRPGDVVRCEIEGIGAIENRVVAPVA